MSDLNSFANAIATAEGYGVAGAIPTVRNNPGDLSSNGTVTTYATPQDGMSALTSKLQNIANGNSSVYSPDMTIAQMGDKWANGDTNWMQNVAAKLGVSPDSTIGKLLGASIDDANNASVTSIVGNAVTSAHSSIIGRYLEDAIFVLIGLMLITAGVFAFKNSSSVITVVGKAAKTAAEVS